MEAYDFLGRMNIGEFGNIISRFERRISSTDFFSVKKICKSYTLTLSIYLHTTSTKGT